MEFKNLNADKITSPSFTRLVNKEYSGLVIRKFTKWGFPLYVGIITDDDLSHFDDLVVGFIQLHKEEFFVNNIQSIRNLSGMLSEYLCEMYPKTEGVAVTFYVDKAFVSSLFGDFMNHTSCRIEYYGLLQMSTGV